MRPEAFRDGHMGATAAINEEEEGNGEAVEYHVFAAGIPRQPLHHAPRAAGGSREGQPTIR